MDIYKNLVFILYKKCNAACSMCCFESNPASTEHLDINRIKDYIAEAKELDYITDISFTGGEPFLEYRKLLELCKVAKACGKKVRTITNGYWATSYDKALKIISEIKRDGVVKLGLSHDNYHREYIKTEYVRNVLMACSEVGLNCDVSLVKIRNEKIGGVIDDMADALNNVSINIIPCLPVGGAKKNFSYENDFDRQVKAESTQCHYGASLVVSYDGNIYPCCSQTVFNTALSVGSFYEMSLKTAICKLKNNAALYLLRNESMEDIVVWAKENTDIQIPDKVVNVCELCELLYSTDNILKIKKFIDEKIRRKLVNCV